MGIGRLVPDLIVKLVQSPEEVVYWYLVSEMIWWTFREKWTLGPTPFFD